MRKSDTVGKTHYGPFVVSAILLTVIALFAICMVVYITKDRIEKDADATIAEKMDIASGEYGEKVRAFAETDPENLTDVFGTEMFPDTIVVLINKDGTIAAASEGAKKYYKADEEIEGKNISDLFSGKNSEVAEKIAENLKNGGKGFEKVKTVEKNIFIQLITHIPKDYISYTAVEGSDFGLIYTAHESEFPECTENNKFMKKYQTLAVAYMIAAAVLVIFISIFTLAAMGKSNKKIKLISSKADAEKERAQIYSAISGILSKLCNKAYCVEIATGKFRLLSAADNPKEKAFVFTGKNFWETEKNTIMNKISEDDADAVADFLKKDTLREKIIRGGGEAKIRFKTDDNGSVSFYSLFAYMAKSGNTQFFVICLKNITEFVQSETKQAAEKEVAVSRLEIYKNAMLGNMTAYAEMNVSRNQVTFGPYVGEQSDAQAVVDKYNSKMTKTIDNLTAMVGDYLYYPGTEKDEYVRNNTAVYLINAFKNGQKTVEYTINSETQNGKEINVRQTYYMSDDKETGEIKALCVMYDITESVEKEKEIKDLSKALDLSRLKISTGQMQPHFLYNVLGSIREIILDDPEYASDLICDFTTHLRACIRSLSNDDLIPFEKEVENIEAYVNIEKMRFGDRMKVEFDLKYTDFGVVPLGIQPLVENAIRHGIYPKKDCLGVVKISSFRQNGFVVVVVKDNGVGFDYDKIDREVKDHKRDSTGLLNLTLRLEKVLNAKVYFDSEIGVGTTATVLIPETKKEDTDESDNS